MEVKANAFLKEQLANCGGGVSKSLKKSSDLYQKLHYIFFNIKQLLYSLVNSILSQDKPCKPELKT